MDKREAAIEAAIEYYTQHRKTWNRSITDLMADFAIEYAGLASANQWVSVEDGLPEEDGYYLATVGSFGIDPSETTCHELNWFKGKWYLPSDEMVEMGPVIAWQKLPQPYTPTGGE